MLSTGVIILINLDFGLIFIAFINMRRTPSLWNSEHFKCFIIIIIIIIIILV